MRRKNGRDEICQTWSGGEWSEAGRNVGYKKNERRNMKHFFPGVEGGKTRLGPRLSQTEFPERFFCVILFYSLPSIGQSASWNIKKLNERAFGHLHETKCFSGEVLRNHKNKTSLFS